MKRITHPTAAATRPAYASTGIEGYFTPGSVPDNIPPTTLTADWCNDVQEAIAAPIEAAGLTLDGTGQAQLLAAIGLLSARRNVLINAGPTLTWHNPASAGTSGVTYPFTRWYVKSVGSTYATSNGAFLAAVAGDPPRQPTWYRSLAVTSVSGANNCALLGQCIESVRTLQGGTASLSFWARVSVAGSFSVSLRQHFGTGGSPSADVTAIGAHKFTAPDTAWHYYTLEGIAVPSIAGKTLGSADNDYLDLQFWVDAGSSFNAQTGTLGQRSVTFDHHGACLSEGPVALPYSPRPWAAERAAVARYYENSNVGAVAQGTGTVATALHTYQVTGASTATYWAGTVPFLAIKRAAPTLTTYNPVNANAQAYDVTTSTDCSATAVGNVTRVNFHLTYTTAAGSAVGDTVSVHWQADAEFVPS